MARFFSLTILPAVLVLLMSAVLMSTGAMADPSTITVTATGSALAIPDKVEFSFGVNSAGPDPVATMDRNKVALKKAFHVLDKAGIDTSDILTTGISLQPRYETDRSGHSRAPRIVGYDVRNTVKVTVHDVTTLGQVIDALVKSGVNGISSVHYGLSDTSALLDKARAQAARKARHKAEVYADAIGTHVIALVSVSETSGVAPRTYMMAKASSSAPGLPVSEGTQSIEARISAVFRVAPDLEAR